jgi:hypothetical protein
MNRKTALILAASACLLALTACSPSGGEDPAVFEYSTSGGKATITKYTGSGGSVTIPSTIDGLPVTSIGDSAFFNCDKLTSVELPSSLISIGYGAFASTNLASIVIPSSVTSIGDSAFTYCTKLASVHVKRYVPGGSPEITAVKEYSFHSNAAGRIIYVPTAAVAAYAADANWSTYETYNPGTIQGE